MTTQTQQQQTQALSPAEQFKEARQQALARVMSGNISNVQEWHERTKAMNQFAFMLTPSTMMGAIAPHYVITPQLVTIDPSVDPESGRGADVYYQRSIHKAKKVDRPGGGGYDWVPTEVSLNAAGLQRILAAAGVNVHDTIWQQDGSKERYLWVCETAGDIIEFTGQVRKLPAGIGSLDARDGSADIGEWTPEEWARRVAICKEQQDRCKTDAEKRKIKPEAINGWTAERVMQVRKYGRQLAKTKSLNGLCRRLGVRQSYSVDELRAKPFVIMRAVYMPDTTNPRIAEMVAAANLGARFNLYPGAALPPAEMPVTHAPGEEGSTIPGDVVDASVEPEPEERMQTAAPPADVEEVVEQAPQPAQQQAAPQPPPPTSVYTVVKVFRKGKAGTPDVQYFVETKEGVTLFTAEEQYLPLLQQAAKDNQPREIITERVMVADKPYRQITEIMPPDGKKY